MKTKKILAFILAACLVLSSVLISSAQDVKKAIIENISVDLNKSTLVKAGNVFSKTDLDNGMIRANISTGWNPFGNVSAVCWPSAIMSLNNKDGEFIRIPSGYKYAINVTYTVTAATANPSIAISYNNADNKDADNGSNILAHSIHSETGTFTLSTIAEGVGNRPLRLVFGGSGKIVIEKVEIERVDASESAKTINCIVDGLTFKRFTTDTIPAPVHRNAKDTVFGGWFNDAAFTSVATDVTDGATYYAKWTSVTREIDILNINRMANYCSGGSLASNTAIQISPVGSALKVDIDKTRSGNIWAGELGLSDIDQQLTLEYADYDDAEQDMVYSDYVTVQQGKRYAINIKYTVTSVEGGLDIGVVSATKALSWSSNDQKIMLAKNWISQTGTYVLTAAYNSGDLIDTKYGGSTHMHANKRLRLAFEGKGSVVIESITVQEVYDNDANVIGVKYSEDGLTYTAGAVKTLDGKWVIPEPALKGDVVEKEFGGWYLESDYKTEMVTPVLKTTYYPKWESVTRKADLTLLNRVRAVNDDGSTNTAIRDFGMKDGGLYLYAYNNPNSVDAGSTASNNWQKHVTIEDSNGHFQVKAGRIYTVTVNYDYLRVNGKNSFQMALVGANSATENDASSVVIGGVSHNSNDYTNWVNDQTLSVSFQTGQNGLEAGDYLRLFFGGSGKISIKSIYVEESFAGDDYVVVKYVDSKNTYTEYIKKGSAPSNPKDMDGFYGWYKNEEFIGKVTTITEPCTIYAKRAKNAYNFDINFDTQSTKDFYSEAHTKSDWATTGGHAEIAGGLGVNGSDAMRITYKSVSGSMTDYATNPLIWLHDTNVQSGDKVAKRFNGVSGTRYLVTLKYKVEETDGKNIQIYVGTRQKSQSSNSAVHDFGTGAWQIQDTAQMGNTITEKKGEWVTVKAYITAKNNWFPVIVVKTNNQVKRSEEEAENPFASILVDDITVSEVVPIINDTELGVMDLENYIAKKYDSKTTDELIGNKNGREVSNEANHTKNGKNSIKLTLMTDSVQHSGNSVIAIDKEIIVPTKDAAYIVKFWVMSKTDMNDVIYSVNTVAGAYTDICSKHQIEARNKINLKANKWTEVTVYIPKLTGIPGENGMLSVALATLGQDGKSVYVDDISVKQIIDSEAIIFEDSITVSTFATFYQRAFKGQAINTLPAMKKDGYLFEGWFDEDGKEYKVSSIFPTDKTELKLYAKWVSTENAVPKDFTAGSFDPEIYDKGVKPYENAYENAETPIYGIANVGSTQSMGWVKDSGMYGNGTADYDGTLVLQNDTYNTFTQSYGRNAIALVNEDGSKFMVVKGRKYSIKYDYISGSADGTSVIQPYISTDSGYGTFGYNIGQGLTHNAVHGTDIDYKTYQEYFVANETGYLYITFTTRSGLGSQHTLPYHKVYVDNLEVKMVDEVKKIEFVAGNTVIKSAYGVEGDKYPVFDTLNGDSNASFDGFYTDAEFTNRITNYVFTSADVQKVYIKYKSLEYNTPSNFNKPIKLDFEETKFLNDYYRQGKNMTYWSRGEATPEWQLLTNSSIAFSGDNYMKLNGYPTYWNIAKFMLYDINNPSGTMLLEKGQTYRITLMSRCEDRYDLPNLTVTLENPNLRYITQAENELSNVSFNMMENEYANGYVCYTIDITVPMDMAYLPGVAIRKNVNDLQTLFIDSISVEKIVDYSVRFEENGGSEIDDFTIQVHETIADPGMPYYEGYVFVGWFYDSALTKLWDFDNMTVENDVTLYAKWEVETLVEDDVEEEDTEYEGGNVPTLLDGDAHEYAKEDNGIAAWAIILICSGGVVALAGLTFVIIFIVRKKKKAN